MDDVDDVDDADDEMDEILFRREKSASWSRRFEQVERVEMQVRMQTSGIQTRNQNQEHLQSRHRLNKKRAQFPKVIFSD